MRMCPSLSVLTRYGERASTGSASNWRQRTRFEVERSLAFEGCSWIVSGMGKCIQNGTQREREIVVLLFEPRRRHNC
jgi:hypothetical protein